MKPSPNIDPERLLVVRIDEPNGDITERLAVWCRYAVVREARGRLAVAIEVAFDEANPCPQAAYYCPSQRLRRVLLPPARVVGIRPYAAEPTEVV